TELAILTSAREHDQPYEWSLHEMEGIAVGLGPIVIDVVRHRKPLAGTGEKESAIIQMGREIFGSHKLSSATYSRNLKLFGERDLVDIVDLMGRDAGVNECESNSFPSLHHRKEGNNPPHCNSFRPS